MCPPRQPATARTYWSTSLVSDLSSMFDILSCNYICQAPTNQPSILAHWCPPCRGFTPTLSKWYTAFKEKNPNFEMVFASSDRDEAAFKEYHSEMSFLALPYSERDAKTALSKKCKVSGIPSLCVFGPDGELITTDGRSKVTEDPEGKNFPWIPPTFEEILPATVLGKSGDVASSTFDDKHLIAGQGCLRELHQQWLRGSESSHGGFRGLE